MGQGLTRWPHTAPPPRGEPAAAHSEAEDCGKLPGHRCLSDSSAQVGRALLGQLKPSHAAQNRPGSTTVPTSQSVAGARITPGNRLKVSFPAEWPRGVPPRP